MFIHFENRANSSVYQDAVQLSEEKFLQRETEDIMRNEPQELVGGMGMDGDGDVST